MINELIACVESQSYRVGLVKTMWVLHSVAAFYSGGWLKSQVANTEAAEAARLRSGMTPEEVVTFLQTADDIPAILTAFFWFISEH
jgi:hypothetical protein